MSDKFAPKLTIKQRAQVEAVFRELLDKAKDLVFDGDGSNAHDVLKDELPWASYLIHATEDGKKNSTIRTPTQRISCAKKIKRSLKKTPTIADLQAMHPLTAVLDEGTIGILNKDLINCCSDLPPSLWEALNTVKPIRRR